MLLDRKGPGFPAGHQVEHETAMYPCFKAGTWYPGRHYTEQVKGDDLSPLFSPGEATAGVLGFPVQKRHGHTGDSKGQRAMKMIKALEHFLQ